MGTTFPRTIVVSAVNIRKGGTLTILRQCLQYLSTIIGRDYRVVALVHKRELCDYPGIEYIEMPDIIKSWFRRLYCEYITMHRVSVQLEERYGSRVFLWLSLHDTTPRVQAVHRAVYCQTSFPFYRWAFQDFKMDFKIPLFAMFTRFAYRINVHKNDYLIVQAEWLRKAFSELLGVEKDKFIVAPPKRGVTPALTSTKTSSIPTFFYASTPDCHKNFEVVCEAARLLERRLGYGKFKLILTVKGNENKYAEWLKTKWSGVKSIYFEGFMTKEKLYSGYYECDCFVFPSRIETWGLPISEFMETNKPMLLADLPYAHETSTGAKQAQFFDPYDAKDLYRKMLSVVNCDFSGFKQVELEEIQDPFAQDWNDMFALLLGTKYTNE